MKCSLYFLIIFKKPFVNPLKEKYWTYGICKALTVLLPDCPTPAHRPVGSYPMDSALICPKTRNHCLLTLQSPYDISSCFSLTRTISGIISR